MIARARDALPRILFLLLLLALPRAAQGQVRPDSAPPDTTRRDTLRVPIPPESLDPDTVPRDSVRGTDTVVVTLFPRYPKSLPTGWGAARTAMRCSRERRSTSRPAVRCRIAAA
jgi:hypothetical protein